LSVDAVHDTVTVVAVLPVTARFPGVVGAVLSSQGLAFARELHGFAPVAALGESANKTVAAAANATTTLLLKAMRASLDARSRLKKVGYPPPRPRNARRRARGAKCV
jgi:hypothetical protein